MTRSAPVPAPLTYPLAGLLTEPPGERRRFPVHGATIPLPDDLRLAEPLAGQGDIARTNRGVIVDARFRTANEGSRSRCLRDIEIPLEVEVHEEVLPSVDLASGAPLHPPSEREVTRLSDHPDPESGPLAGEAISHPEPIAPLCEANCPGLCPECGERLGPGPIAHPE